MDKASVKLADVAKAAGVSQGTASNVFSRPEIVREEVRERVLGVARELGYAGPDIKGRLLRAGKVNAIGVASLEPLSYFFEDPWARALMAEISEICDASGTGIALVSAKNQQKLAWNIRSAVVDGFILLCVEGGEELVALTRDRQLPFVALALGPDDSAAPSIGIDNVAGGLLAGRHVAGLGHRRVVVLALEFDQSGHVGRATPERVAQASYQTTRDRALGYWQALGEVGVAAENVPVFETLSDRDSVEIAMEQMFAGAERPTAVLAMSDRVAMLAMDWLARRGVNVPGDVSVVGFDGVPEAGMVGLTTVAQPFKTIAQRAVRAILDNAVPVAPETVPLGLVVRGSTAAAPGQ